jgi:hypothetical protein
MLGGTAPTVDDFEKYAIGEMGMIPFSANREKQMSRLLREIHAQIAQGKRHPLGDENISANSS